MGHDTSPLHKNVCSLTTKVNWLQLIMSDKTAQQFDTKRYMHAHVLERPGKQNEVEKLAIPVAEAGELQLEVHAGAFVVQV
jgi:hypothetical protein